MVELSFRLILQTDHATGKLAGVRQAADSTRAEIEKPAKVKISAEQSLATIRDVKIAFDGVMQALSAVTTGMNKLLDANLSSHRAMVLAKVAFGEAAGEMANFASAMQAVTNFEDDQMLALMAKLAQTFKLNKDEIQQLVPALLDFTEANAATGMSLESAVDLMGRALNGHTEMLGRYGIDLDSTRLASEGLSYLMEKLNDDYSGTAAALADLRTQNKNAWGDIQETVGGMLQTLINPLLQGLKYLMDGYNSLSPIMKGFVAGITIAIPVIVTVTTATTALAAAVTALKAAVNPVAGIIALATGAVTAFSFAMASSQSSTNDLAEAQDNVMGSMKKAQAAVDEEAVKFGILANRLLEVKGKTEQTTESKAEMQAAIVALNRDYGAYLGNIHLETAGYNELTVALRATSEALIQKKTVEYFGDAIATQAAKVANLKVQLSGLLKQYEQVEISPAQDNFVEQAGLLLSDVYDRISDPVVNSKGFAQMKSFYQALNIETALLAKAQDNFESALKNIKLPELGAASTGGSSGGASPAQTDAQREAEQRKRDAERLIAELADLRRTETEKIDLEYAKRAALIREYTEDGSDAERQAIADLDTWKTQQQADVLTRERDTLRSQFERQVAYYSNLESLGVSSYDALKTTMEEYYAWAKDNLSGAEADLVLAQLRETNLRWGEHIREKEAEQRAVLDEFARTDLDLADNAYQAELMALDRYYADRHDKMIAAGLSEQQIEQQKQESIRKLNEQTGIQAMKSVSGTLGQFANAANKESRRGFALWKALAMSQAMIDTLGAAIAAYRSVAGIPGIGPGLAVAAAAAATAAGFANIARIESTKYEPPRAARGGYLSGPSHSGGGILIEAEGDEYITAKDRVRALGRDFFDFVNFGPLNQVRALFSQLPVPSMALPAGSLSFASGGYVSSSSGFGGLEHKIDALIDAVVASRPQISIAVDPLSNDPVRVSEIADRGKIIRSEF